MRLPVYRQMIENLVEETQIPNMSLINHFLFVLIRVIAVCFLGRQAFCYKSGA